MNETTEYCKRCAGTGWLVLMAYGDMEPCDYCDGQGYLEIEDDESTNS